MFEAHSGEPYRKHKASWGKGHQVAHHYHHHLLHEVLKLETISTGSMFALVEHSVVTCDYACHAAAGHVSVHY